MRVAFRVDAGERVGMGHLVRSLSLARELIAGGVGVRVVMSRPSDAVAHRVSASGASLVAMNAPPGSSADAGETLAITRSTDVLVVDGYSFTPEYVQRLSRATVPTVTLDDMGGAVGDAIINGNFHAGEIEYPESALCLLGPRWALLDRRFATVRAAVPPRSDGTPRVLVTMGGSDPTHQTERVLEALADLPPWRCTIVLGSFAGRLAEVARAALVRSGRAPTEVLHDVDDMASVMAAHDVCVAAAGGTALELACIGVPALLVAVAENQRRVLEATSREGIAVALGWYEDVGVGRVRDELARLVGDPVRRAAMRERGRALVDGRGAERVATKIIHLARLGRTA